MRRPRTRICTGLMLLASMLFAAVPWTAGTPRHRCDAVFCPARHGRAEVVLAAHREHAGEPLRMCPRSCPHHRRGYGRLPQAEATQDCLVGSCDHDASPLRLALVGRLAVLSAVDTVNPAAQIMSAAFNATQESVQGCQIPSVPPPRPLHV